MSGRSGSVYERLCIEYLQAKMQKIIGLLKFPSTSVSSSGVSPSTPTIKLDLPTSQLQQSPLTAPSPHMASCLESLPAEIINHILAFLPPVSLAALLRTSHQLQSHAQNDLLWMRFIKDSVPEETPLPSPAPAKNWKELYTAHHPYWFLTRHKVWFSDRSHSGSLVIARYDHRRGCIEACRLLARHGAPYIIQQWEHNPAVHIHLFKPEINLMLDDPVIKLNIQSQKGSRLSSEVKMQTGQTPGIASMLSLCHANPSVRRDSRMALWPPSTIPSVQRVRNRCSNQFRIEPHRPKTLAGASDRTFRLRTFLQWSYLMQPLSSVRMGEDVSTFSTLLEESYLPTVRKPYQGIWVGDYSAHGCEFLLVMQIEHPPEVDASRRSSTDSGLPSGLVITQKTAKLTAFDRPDDIYDTTDAQNRALDKALEPVTKPAEDPAHSELPSGRIEAIKLTGDINVPRGECTWFADDISDGGLIRVADEEKFRGARIVKSMGQVAAENFMHSRYIDSQLILISHDTIAQYWQVSWPQPPLACLRLGLG